MERREVHGLCQSVTSLRSGRPGWIEEGRLKILFNTERQRITGIDAPTIFEFAKTDEQRRILTLFASTSERGRPIVTPPEVPADRVAVLRKSFDAVMSDPDLIADAERNKLVVKRVSGDELAGLVRDMVSTPPEIIMRMQAMMR